MQERKVSQAPDLFSSAEMGPLKVKNRVVMAPLTRSRAGPGNVPTQLNALYYAQRASAGLIIAEATQIAPEGQGYISTPGIHSADQVEGWKCVTKASPYRRWPHCAATLAHQSRPFARKLCSHARVLHRPPRGATANAQSRGRAI